MHIVWWKKPAWKGLALGFQLQDILENSFKYRGSKKISGWMYLMKLNCMLKIG